MSESASGDADPRSDPRAALRTSPLARWLAPTSESRVERIVCGDVDPRPWPAAPDPDDQLVALIRSVRQRGIVEPLLLRPLEGGRFQVVLGSRRLEAARRLRLTEIPAIVRELDDSEAALLAAWSLLPRLQPGEMVEVASRLSAAGVGEDEVAVLLGAAGQGRAAPPAQRWQLVGGSGPLRFARSATPAHLLLDALGERRRVLLALRGADPGRLH